MQKIDLAKDVFFYDDRSKDDTIFELVAILYQDEEVCLALASNQIDNNEDAEVITEKLLFKLENGEVINSEYYAWIATNDISWMNKEKDE